MISSTSARPGRAVPARRELQSPVRYVDWLLPLTAIAIAVFGIFMNYSATWRLLDNSGGDPFLYAKRQTIFVLIGVVAMVVAALVDYRVVRDVAPQLYLVSLVFLTLVLFVGKEVAGARAWFQLPGFQLQPSEFGKLAAIAGLAAYAASRQNGMGLRELINALALMAVPMGLVFRGGDLGTMLVYIAVTMGVLLVAGTKVRHIVALALAGVLAILFVFNADDVFGVELLNERQGERLTAFLDQESDITDANYNLQQSQIALGSGGLTGRGFLQGSQTNLNLVPEQQTDFIYTAAGEELGFLFGSLPLLAAYLLLVWRTLRAAQLASDRFGALMCVGVLSMFLFQIFQNMGMTMGIMPIAGIPLPFMSHGGSSIITAFIAVGLVVNVRSRRFAV